MRTISVAIFFLVVVSSAFAQEAGGYDSEIPAERCRYYNETNFGAFTGTVSSAPDYETAVTRPEVARAAEGDIGVATVAIPDSVAVIIAAAKKQAAVYAEGRSLRLRPGNPGWEVSSKERFCDSPCLSEKERAALRAAKENSATLASEQSQATGDVARGYGR